MKNYLLFALLLFYGAICAQTGNDECANAITIPVNPAGVCNQSATAYFENATASAQPNDCNGIAYYDIWFKFTATATRHHIIAPGAPVGFKATLFSGGCGSLNQVACYSMGSNVEISGLTPGQTYTLKVYSSSATQQQIISFTICINSIPSINVDVAYTAQQLVE
jgi:hypothetical protein